MSSLLFVLNCCFSRFRSVIIPVDGVKIDEFGPSLFLWLGLGKNSLKKVKLLEINLWVPSDWKKKKKKKKTDFKSTEYQTKRETSYII